MTLQRFARYCFCILITAAVLLVSGPARADTDRASERTSRHEIQSQPLDEKREIYVRLPQRHEPGRVYPVVYVLDGEWSFDYVAAYIDYLSDNRVYPDVIVTGIRNVNRNRDYVPRPDPYHPHTGEAGRFLQFVAEEWTAFMAQNYQVSPERVLVGHSFGGVFTLNAFFDRPELFDAYIALGTSAWVSGEVLFEKARARFDQGLEKERFVYMAVGEGDGGPTRPSSEKLAALFEKRAPDNLEWTFAVTPRTDHFKNVPSGLHEAFMALFPGWGFAEELKVAGEGGGAEAVNAWFGEKEQRLGWRFQPAWFDLSITAILLARDGRHEAGLAVMAAMRRHFPDDAHVASFSANVFRRTGDLEGAEGELRRAIRLAREQGLDPNAIQIEDLEQALERIEQDRE